MDIKAQKGEAFNNVTTLDITEIALRQDNPLERQAHHTLDNKPSKNPRHITEFRTLSIHVDDDKGANSSTSSHDNYLGKRKAAVTGTLLSPRNLDDSPL
jgi:hypothetical protein